MEKLKPKMTKRKAAKDDLVHVSSSDLKVGSPVHRQKFPERYGYNYTSSLDQALYPKLGTAPSEKQIIKWKLEESSEPIVKNKILKKVITDAEIQKRLDKQRGPHMWDLIKSGADQPEDKKQVRDIIRKNYKRNPKSTPRDELKYLKAEDRGSEIKLDYKEVKAPIYFPTNKRKEEIPPPNFEVSPDPDLFKGLGSLLATTRKDYQK